MERIAAVSAGDAAIASLALVLVAYEAWLYHTNRAHREHLWSSLIALSCALYAVAMVVQYNVGFTGLARTMVQIQFASLLLLLQSLFGFALAHRQVVSRWPHRIQTVSNLVWLVLIVATPLVVPHKLVPVEMFLVDGPYPQPEVSIWTDLLFAYGAVVVGVVLFWLIKESPRLGSRTLFPTVGIGLWLLAGVHDALMVSLPFEGPCFLMEYGFFAFTLSLAANHIWLHTHEHEVLRAERDQIEAFSRSIASSVAEGVALLDHRGEVVVWNPQMEIMTGLSSEAAVGRAVIGLLALEGSGSELVEAAFKRALQGERISTPELRVQREGEESFITCGLSPFSLEPQGRPIGVVVLTQDITTRKHLQSRIMQMDRMITVGTLAASVGHEINNPLAYTTANVDFALKEIETLSARSTSWEDESAADALEEMHSALDDARDGVTRIRDIVRDLKLFSRREDNWLAVDLADCVESALSMAQNTIKQRARFVRAYSDVPLVMANPGRISQVVLNLLINAAQAIKPGGVEENTITARLDVVEGWCKLEIEDTGSGIDPEVLPRLFEPFFSTKGAEEGTGLGLSICREIVQQHGGRIEVESLWGRGSIFRVLLPPANDRQEHQDSPAEGTAIGRGRSRILVVDDEPLIGALVCRMFKNSDEVIAVQSVREARDTISAAGRFDVILCDLMMPDITGMAFYESLLETDPGLAARIIFITGGATDARLRAFLAEFPDRVVEKPFKRDQLEEALQGIAP